MAGLWTGLNGLRLGTNNYSSAHTSLLHRLIDSVENRSDKDRFIWLRTAGLGALCSNTMSYFCNPQVQEPLEVYK